METNYQLRSEDTKSKEEQWRIPTQSESIKNLAGALVKAQSELRGAKKDADNPFYHSKYADLNSCWEAAREPLTKNGLCIIQTTEIQGQDLGVKTLLVHTSGEWISSFLPFTEKPQVTGSAISYNRRYGLSAMVGLYAEDDDAERATDRPQAQKSMAATVAKPHAKNTHKDFEEAPPPFDPPLNWNQRK